MKQPTGECPTPEEGRQYEGVITVLADRISKLIPQHPEIMNIEDVWELFRIPGFKCDDLGPSMAQAEMALRIAKLGHGK